MRVADNRQPVFALDHDVQNDTEENVKKYKKIEEFAKQVRPPNPPARIF
jgi:homoaconitate hydratase